GQTARGRAECSRGSRRHLARRPPPREDPPPR
ncbi:MAG: hypothetical protein AVDCRST_MAG88-4091, partial [uncultured Thermomicrobiales bacterium]